MKSDRFLIFILLTSVFSALLLLNSGNYNLIPKNFTKDPINLYDLRVSGPQINITTPENKTYTTPMSGYYPATYGFENDAINSNPYGWSTSEPSSCSVDVINGIDNHNRVVYLTDNNAAEYSAINKSISLTSGIIEFWIRAGETNRQHYFQISDDANYGVHLYMDQNGMWRYTTTGPVYNTIEAYNASQWYHVKIEFDTSHFHLWIDGVSKDDGIGYGLFGSPTSFKKVQFNTDQSETGGNMWVDAIGYSWDPDYTIGDNTDEGLLLSFDTGFTPDWLGYSLDGQTNRTIIGNTTFPFPTIEGLHSIQVFGNDSLGTIYQSDIRYFTILYYPIISIISPIYHEFYGNTAPTFSLTLTESNPHSTWYNLNNGVNISFSGLSGSINQTEWDKFDNGTVSIRFYVNDTWDLEGYDEVIVWKDTYFPSSSIYFIPHSGINVINETTEISFTADDVFGSGVSYVRYKINDSSWITYAGPFNLANYPYGDKLITYQAVDQVDNYETEQQIIIFRTDTIPPSSSILYTPYETPNIVIPTTLFTISVNDDTYGSGVSLIRYKVDDSSWITYTGHFNLAGFEYAGHIITYQAIDIEGNIETEKIINIVLTPAPSPPGISGFNIVIILGIISIVSVALVKKKSK